MDVIVFVGLQASGKSTFYQQNFADTHVRINLDMLHTRNREKRLIETCLEIGQPFVIDNTNITREARQRYFPMLQENEVSVHGYYFQSEIEPCKLRNNLRNETKQVPLPAILGTYAKMELPTLEEGFEKLFYVRINDTGGFPVEEWKE